MTGAGAWRGAARELCLPVRVRLARIRPAAQGRVAHDGAVRRRDVLRAHRGHRMRAGEDLALAECCASSSRLTSRRSATHRSWSSFLLIFSDCRRSASAVALEAALLAMIVNVGAYATEIVRAGIESVPRGTHRSRPGARTETLADLPLRRPDSRHSGRSSRAGGQFILIMLVERGVGDLGGGTDGGRRQTESRNFRTSRSTSSSTGMYLAMSFGSPALFALIDRWCSRPGASGMIREFTYRRILVSCCRLRAGPLPWPLSPSSAAASSGSPSRSRGSPSRAR